MLFIRGSGDLLIASQAKHIIRIVYSATATIGTFAGTGTSGFTGDGGFASSARLAGPAALAVLPDNSLLIADMNNHRIRIVSPEHKISTWLGNGTACSAGDGQARSMACVNAPIGVSVHPITGDVFIVEQGGLRLRRVDVLTDIVFLAVGPVGSGAPIMMTLVQPRQLLPLPGSVDNFLLADNCQVWQVNFINGSIVGIAGTEACGNSGDGGPASGSSIGAVGGMLVDSASGIVLVADTLNNVTRAFKPGGRLWRLAGTTSPSAAAIYGDGGANTSLLGPSSLVWEPTTGAVVVAESLGHAVRSVSAACFNNPFPTPVSRKLKSWLFQLWRVCA